MSGKTIVGGLAGGLVAVEWVKRRLGIRVATGDLFAVPLALGLAVGRIGCFLTGLADDTCGNATRLPFGVDFGDGVRRHPTQLYEIVFVLVLAAVLWGLLERPHRGGEIFKTFMVSYATWRLLVDFLKPRMTVLELSYIQWTCLAIILYYATGFWRRLASQEASEFDQKALAR
jgi:phosphatidylglycerol:prolipoprotein diacylglycerol transferase